jgi:hypothetical protein
VDFDLLEERLVRAVSLVDKLPDKYRDRVLDALVTIILSQNDASPRRHNDPEPTSQAIPREEGTARLSGAARAFLTKHAIDSVAFANLAQQNGSDWDIYIDPDAKSKAEGQVQMALLAALRTLLNTGNFTFDAEQLKDGVKQQGFWDPGNYWKYFGKKLFSKIPTSQDPRGLLNGDGQSALAELIKRRL